MGTNVIVKYAGDVTSIPCSLQRFFTLRGIYDACLNHAHQHLYHPYNWSLKPFRTEQTHSHACIVPVPSVRLQVGKLYNRVSNSVDVRLGISIAAKAAAVAASCATSCALPSTSPPPVRGRGPPTSTVLLVTRPSSSLALHRKGKHKCLHILDSRDAVDNSTNC